MKYKLIVLLIFAIISNPISSQNWEGIGMDKDIHNASEYHKLYTDTISNLLYMCGSHLFSNDTVYNAIASWNGTSVNSLTGINHQLIYNSDIRVMCRYQNYLYVGGGFKFAGETMYNSIAMWDSSDWHIPISDPRSKFTGEEGLVTSFLVIEDTLYVGGTFDSIAGYNFECNGLAKYDGSTWYPVKEVDTTDFNANIQAMSVYNGDLYVAGNFGLSLTDRNIARWDGEQWQSVGGGMQGGLSQIQSLAVYDDKLYMDGLFSKNNANSFDYIASWDGIQLAEVADGVLGEYGGNGQVHSLCTYDNELWVGGVFETASGIPSKYIAKWNDSKWCGFGNNIEDRILSMAIYNDELYVMGGFEQIDTFDIKYVAKWIGGNYVDTCSILQSAPQINNELNNLIIYPKPTSGEFNIKLNSETQLEIEISIFSINGSKILKKQFFQTNEIKINNLHLKKGVYFVKIKTDEFVKTKKLIIN